MDGVGRVASWIPASVGYVAHVYVQVLFFPFIVHRKLHIIGLAHTLQPHHTLIVVTRWP